MLDNLNKYNIVLASNSPRRRELLAGLGIPFEVRVPDDIDESYPAGELKAHDVPLYIAAKKILGKPSDKSEACRMLHKLSGKTHCVVTGVCLTTSDRQSRFSVSTDVTFKTLADEEIDYYVSTCRPFDKAGAYGIQEWIGYIGVTGLSGSYFNVVGLPVQRIYSELLKF